MSRGSRKQDPETPVAGVRGAIRRRRWHWWAFAAAQLVVVVVLLEVCLRALGPHDSGLRALLHQSTIYSSYTSIETLPQLMSTTLMGFRPNQTYGGFALNSRSLRTIEYSTAKPPRAFRVVAIGDSFTFGGSGIADADHWTGRLLGGLQARLGREAQVLRLAVPAVGPPFYHRMWRVEGSRLEADLAIVAFFVGNDFFDEQGREPGWEQFASRLASVSYTFRAARNLFRLSAAHDGTVSSRTHDVGDVKLADGAAGGFELPRPDGQGPQTTGPAMSLKRYLEVERERMSLCLNSERTKLSLRLQRALEPIEAIHAEATLAGTDFLVMVIPDEFQIDPELAAAVAESAGRSLADYDLDRPQRELVAAFESHGVPVLDLLPVFRQRARIEPLYLPRDTHWNVAGNRLAARLLLERLEALSTLPNF